jgi:hypothetical protein
MNKAYGSSMTGDISWFAQHIATRDQSVSFTVDDGINLSDTSDFRVLHQVEPPEVLDVVDKIIANHTFYDLILGWNERILKGCPNSVFLPEAVCSWIGRSSGGSVYKADNVEKQFAVSFLTSSKAFCPGHKLRCEIYDMLPSAYGDLKVIKHMSPPRIPDKRTILVPYQFSIAVENAKHNNWFADKIVDCFVAKTLPIYWGCPNLNRFFNMDGVVCFNDCKDLPQILSSLTPDFYNSRLEAIEDNYTRVLQYVHTWDRIEEEITKGIERKQRLNLQHEEIKPPATTREIPPRAIRRPICRSL